MMVELLNVEIKRAKVSDLQEILNVIKICELDNRDLISENFLIATNGGKVIGCIRHKQHNNLEIEICSLGVLPEYRGKGIGKSLLKRKIEELIHNQVYEIYIVTVDDRIFVPFGFKRISEPMNNIKEKIEWCKENLPVNKEYFAMKYEFNK